MRLRQTRWGVWIAKTVVLLSLQGCGGGSTEAPLQLAPETRRALTSRPAELRLAQGRLRVVSLYKAQALILADSAPLTRRERIDRLVQEVYRPHAAFWKGYAGDEGDFRAMARRFFASESPLTRTLPQLAVVNLDSLFEVTAAWLQAETGLHPEGTWYLVYGPGVTQHGRARVARDGGGLHTAGSGASATRRRPVARTRPPSAQPACCGP